MIKNLIFDFGKVLVDYDFFHTIRHFFETEADFNEFATLFTSEEFLARCDKEDEPFAEIIKDCQRQYPKYAFHLQKFYEDYPALVIGEIAGMRDLLTRLRAEGFRLYGLTNWCSMVHKVMEKWDILTILDDRIISSEEKLIKPDVAIFQRLCDKFGVKPEECVFTDDKAVNVEGATKIGMKAILFKDAVQYEQDLRKLLRADIEVETEARVAKAVDYFKQGYNCTQSVTLTFADWYGFSESQMARVSGSFGGGIGRMRETCGAACGMFMLAGLEVTNINDAPEAFPKEGNPYPDQELKKKDYEVVQRLAADFKQQTGSLNCKELLGLLKQRADGTLPEIEITATPEARTDEYYRKRPCIRMVETAVRLYMKYIQEKYNR